MQIQWKTITKIVVHQCVALGAARIVNSAVTSYTNVDPDRFVVRIGTLMAGEVLADACEAQTDKLVDKTFEVVAKQIKKESPAE